MPDTRQSNGDLSQKVRQSAAFLSAVLTAAGLAAGPATATASKARPSCDRLKGTTLEANTRVRLFREDLTKSQTSKLSGFPARSSSVRFRACSYRTNRVSTVYWDDDPTIHPEPVTYTWATNGDYVAVSASEPGSDEPTDRSAGISTESLRLWNGRTRRTIHPDIPSVGVRFSELLLSPSGSVAAIGNPYGLGGAHAPLTESVVEVYEPAVDRQVWRTVATAPARTLSGLALGGATLVWRDQAGIQQTPLL